MAKRCDRREALKFIGTTLLFTLTAPLARGAGEAAKFVAVRIWPASAYTRVTIESAFPLEYKYFHLTDPERLVLDIQNAHLDEVIKGVSSKILARDPYIALARVGQFDATTVRVVFDLKQKVNPQVFTLKPVDKFKNRLVVDLYPGGEAEEDNDPLYALLQDYNQGKVSSTGAVEGEQVTTASARPDILGDKINEIAGKSETPPGGRPPAKLPEDVHIASSESGKKPGGAATSPRARGIKDTVVILDPGHGGEDTGAIGPSGTYEKDIVLNIAREAKSELKKAGFKVYMTRDEDVFIPLRVRVAKARQLKGNIFVSIHADSFTSPTAKGTGVYALSQKGATSAAARYLAQTQNQADEIGGVKKVGDKNVDNTLFDLTQTATVNRSLKLGDLVLNELGKINKLHKATVNQANFAVLKAPDIPSILVESAFISNPTEESLLRSSRFRKQVAASITAGVLNFTRSIN